jgi:polysaccharide biosynthesis transport protein
VPNRDGDAFVDLRQYLQVLLRRKWMVAGCAALLGAVALATSLTQEPVYRASAQLILQTQQAPSVFDSNTGVYRDPLRAVQTEIQVLQGRTIRDAVEDIVPNPAPVSANSVGLTDILQVNAESTSPALASRTANAYATSYVEYRRRRALETVLAAGREIQEKLSSLDQQIAALQADIDRAGGEDEAADLVARRTGLIDQQSLFRQRLDQLQVDAELSDAGVEVVAPAEVPTNPVRPKPVRTAALAAVAGLLIGAALALLRDRLDESIRTKEDVAAAVPDVPVVATVPAVPSWKDRRTTELVSSSSPNDPAAEAYRSLRTAIQFMSLDRTIQAIQITSPHAAEGKSTTLANLAVTLARTGKRVVVVCCDLRRPRIHEFFGLENRAGFTSVLLGEAELGDALQLVASEPNIIVLSAGPPPPNPSELLSGKSARNLLEQLKSASDIVLVDCPPVLPVTDATIISGHVDATLVVASAGDTSGPQLAEAVRLLQNVEAPLVGIVLNGVSPKAGYGGTYAYTYGREEERDRLGRRPDPSASGSRRG